jgi:hypothetical protein
MKSFAATCSLGSSIRTTTLSSWDKNVTAYFSAFSFVYLHSEHFSFNKPEWQSASSLCSVKQTATRSLTVSSIWNKICNTQFTPRADEISFARSLLMLDHRNANQDRCFMKTKGGKVRRKNELERARRHDPKKTVREKEITSLKKFQQKSNAVPSQSRCWQPSRESTDGKCPNHICG